MTIVEALKDDCRSLRITGGGDCYAERWLVWSDALSEWVVYQHRFRAKENTVLYTGKSEEGAVRILLEG